MTRKTLGYVHLIWTCPRCDTQNPGPHKFCNGCGSPQPEDVEFEQPAQERLIEDAAEIARAKAGPDIHCPYCETRNLGSAKFCGACGGDLAAAEAREAGRVLGAHRAAPVEPIACPACETQNPPDANRCTNCGGSLVKREPDTPLPTKKPVSRRGIFGFAVIAIGAIIALIAVFTRTTELTGVVQVVAWELTIPIESLGPVEHDAWFDEIPADSELVSCSQELRSTQDEPVQGAVEVCGTPYTIDDGSGYGEVVQDCIYEVYDDWCNYTVQDWIVIDQVTATGSDLNPSWPQFVLKGEEREGEGKESYEVIFETEEQVYTFTTTDPDLFSQFAIGSEWLLEVNQLNAVVSVEPSG